MDSWFDVISFILSPSPPFFSPELIIVIDRHRLGPIYSNKWSCFARSLKKMNRVLNVVRVSRAKIDASKLFVPCLAKEPFRAMGLEGWSMGRGGAERRVWEIPLSRDFKSRDNGDCMVLDFYSDSHQQRPHTSHFFCPGDSTYPPSRPSTPLSLHLHPFPTRLLDSPPRVRDFALSKVARLFWPSPPAWHAL